MAWALAKILQPPSLPPTQEPPGTPPEGAACTASGPVHTLTLAVHTSSTALLLSAMSIRAVQVLRDHPAPEAPSIASGGSGSARYGSRSRSDAVAVRLREGMGERRRLLESDGRGRVTPHGPPDSVGVLEPRGSDDGRAMSSSSPPLPSASAAMAVHEEVFARASAVGLSRRDLLGTGERGRGGRGEREGEIGSRRETVKRWVHGEIDRYLLEV